MADKIRMGIIGTGLAFERLHYPVSCFPCEMTKDGFARTEWRQHPEYQPQPR